MPPSSKSQPPTSPPTVPEKEFSLSDSFPSFYPFTSTNHTTSGKFTIPGVEDRMCSSWATYMHMNKLYLNWAGMERSFNSGHNGMLSLKSGWAGLVHCFPVTVKYKAFHSDS